MSGYIGCPPSCSKVKQQLRAAIAEAPCLLNEISLWKNGVGSPSPQDFILEGIEDEQKYVITPADIPKTLVHHEKITMDTPLERAEDIIKPKPIEEQIAIQEPEIIQEVTIIQESTVIPTEEITDHDDEKIESIEERESIAEETVVEPVKDVPAAADELTEIVEDEIDRREVSMKYELELPREPDADFEYGEEEDALTDYDRFIDEELQKSLPAVIAKEIPDEPKEVREEIFYKKTDREEPAGPSKEQGMITAITEEPQARIEVLAKRRARVSPTRPLEIASREPVGAPVPAVPEDIFDETCPSSLDREGKRLIYVGGFFREENQRVMRQLEERRRVVNHYYLTRGFNYFEDVCKCSLTCILHTLSRDQFARSIFASLALFAVGLKLCSELDAWEMPRRVT